MENPIQKINCSLCGNNADFFASKNGFDLYKCESCKFLFVYPLPEVVDVYNESYFAGADNGFGYVNYDADKEPMIPTFEKYIDIIAKFGKRVGKLLDIGAATGFFMQLAENRGFETTGIEISDFAAEKGRDKGLNVITTEWFDFPENSFDIVTMFDVLEHVRDPKKILADVYKILKKDGLLVINTPDTGSLIAKIFGKHWHLIVPPEHLHYFSRKNLENYLKQNGFEIKLNTSIGKQFTFAYIFETLYKWQNLKIWKWLSSLFANSKLYVPLNTHDNLFLIAEKK